MAHVKKNSLLTLLFSMTFLSHNPMVAISEKNIDAIFISTAVVSSLISAGLTGGVTHKISSDNSATLSAGIISSIITAGFFKGLYNIRAENEMLYDIESRYGLIPVYDWYQKPGDNLVKLICYAGDDQIKSDEISNFSSYFIDITKTNMHMMENLSQTAIWNFAEFAQSFPHIDHQGSYGISKAFFAKYKDQDFSLQDLRDDLDFYINTIVSDFHRLKKLTNLSNSYKIPTTLQDFMNLEQYLQGSHQFVLLNATLGFAGYSPLFNGQRVKTCMKNLTQIHTFLLQLRHLLQCCSDDPATAIKNSAGNLSFTIQHATSTQDIHIK